MCLCVLRFFSATFSVCYYKDTCKNMCIILTELMHKKCFVSIEKGRKKRTTQVRYCVSASHCRLCFVLVAQIALPFSLSIFLSISFFYSVFFFKFFLFSWCSLCLHSYVATKHTYTHKYTKHSERGK